jgi:hypothetical protein
LDEELRQAVIQGGVVGAQGRAASGLIRDQARAVGAAAAALGRSPAGAQLVMAAMDQHLEAMQRQVQSSRAQYQGVSATLRQLAAGYQTLVGTKDSPPPAVPLGADGGEDGGEDGEEVLNGLVDRLILGGAWTWAVRPR